MCCWPSWPAVWPPPLSTMASLFAAPLRNLGYGLAQLREQREAAEAA